MKYTIAIFVLLSIVLETSLVSVNSMLQSDLFKIEVEAHEDGEDNEEQQELEDDCKEFKLMSWANYLIISTRSDQVCFRMHESSCRYTGEIPTPPPEFRAC